jgi:hypothetical protein
LGILEDKIRTLKEKFRINQTSDQSELLVKTRDMKTQINLNKKTPDGIKSLNFAILQFTNAYNTYTGNYTKFIKALDEIERESASKIQKYRELSGNTEDEYESIINEKEDIINKYKKIINDIINEILKRNKITFLNTTKKLSGINDTDTELIIPDKNFIEEINKYKEKPDKEIKDITNIISNIDQHIVPTISAPIPSIRGKTPQPSTQKNRGNPKNTTQKNSNK